MGGSFARAIHGFRGCVLFAFDRDEGVLSRAQEEGVIARGFCPGEEAQMLSQCDLVMIALYPEAAIDFLRRFGARCKPGCVVTDMVGVKEAMVSTARAFLPNGASFVGGHPMAGLAKSGFSAANSALFEGCNYILVEEADTDESALALASDMAKYLGAGHITRTDAQKHDRIIAYTSQMAHVLAAAIMLHGSFPESCGFTGGSFGDLTRVARLNDEMWSQLFLLNRDALCDTLRTLEEGVAAIRQDIARGDKASLQSKLRASTARKDGWDRQNRD